MPDGYPEACTGSGLCFILTVNISCQGYCAHGEGQPAVAIHPEHRYIWLRESGIAEAAPCDDYIVRYHIGNLPVNRAAAVWAEVKNHLMAQIPLSTVFPLFSTDSDVTFFNQSTQAVAASCPSLAGLTMTHGYVGGCGVQSDAEFATVAFRCSHHVVHPCKRIH